MASGIQTLMNLGRPVPRTVKAVVSSGWSRPRGHGPHTAIDIPLAQGTPLLAMSDGEVIRYWNLSSGAAGIWVGLRHAGGVVTRYMHMSKIGPFKLGARVRKGDVIGWSGNTGDSAGPHLHTDILVPKELLPSVASLLGGAPKVAWGTKKDPYGYKVPAEPFIPVDGFNTRTAADAGAAGVPLKKPGIGISSTGAVLAVTVIAGIAVAYYR